MELEAEKIYHHHTPRFYLLPWADADERILWLGYGKIMRSGLTVVGGENHFYRLQELTNHDVETIRELIKRLPLGGQKGHRQLLAYYTIPSAAKRFLDETGDDNPEARQIVDVTIANLDENYHTSIENGFRRFLEQMLAGDTSFYDDDHGLIDFFHGLSVQYLRTKALRERIITDVSGLFEDMGRVWPLLSHICAVTMGGSLYLTRKQYKIVLLDNHTVAPFITSDQPIINLHGNPRDNKPPERMELYYPLSPNKAMLYLEKDSPTPNQSLSIEQAHAYNVLMAGHAGRQIFANSEDYLKLIQSYLQTNKVPA